MKRRDCVAGAPDIGHHYGRVGRRFDEDHPEIVGRPDGLIDSLALTGGNRNTANSKRLEKSLDEGLGSAIDWDRIDDAVPGFKTASKAVIIAAMPELKTTAPVAPGSSGRI